ncbi:MAG: hypothetical protein ABI855_10955 [Bacteroidota bacterium]
MIFKECNLLGLLIIVFIRFSAAQSNNCDSSLEPEQSEFAYKNLNNRCEGFYYQLLSGEPLQVISLLKGNIEFSWQLNTKLTVKRADSLKSLLNIRAVSIESNVHYRMDATLSGNESFEWPIYPYIYQRNILPKLLGVYGWTGDEYDKIFSPLIVVEKDKSIHNDTIVLKIRTISNLNQLSYRFIPCVSKTDSKDLGNKSANSVIEIKIPPSSKKEGLLNLEIEFIKDDEWGSDIFKIWF